ncbi:hypothetical protein Poli38472_010186 [Pythium oligandrum]|uniref:non-specific serine/threonine protein kinase n=1 Tax=Pythium oligandrum TaxID=41045 RepID=A0A8K1C8Q4_PYTOL|nr:hypothetical protein Poli38472_010186 [Pythium oligandrum]|eukprot:TMW58627.1 hypothetical protein Poli38472_010186 [Pythium oligandrum]
MHAAVKQDDLQAVTRLLQDGGDVNATEGRVGRTALHYAAQKNEKEITETLFKFNAAVDMTTTWSKMTPLHYAAEKDSIDVARLLIEKGAAISPQDRDGRTPLHCAAINDSVAVATLLLEKGASLDAVNKNGETPLHLVAKHSRTAVGELLLKHGAPLEATTALGRTPLHDAAAHCRMMLGRLLLEKGADVSCLDKDGNTPVRCLALSALSADRALEDELRLLYRLMAAGSPWSEQDDDYVKKLAREKHRDTQISGLLAAIRTWSKQRQRGLKNLTRLPLEVYKRGGMDVRVYFKSIVPQGSKSRPVKQESNHEIAPNGTVGDDEPIYRKKLCVIGPSFWGKTSFIKTLTTNQATMESADDRTIGIDIYSWQFASTSQENGEKRQYEVTFWDFAGQDEYQSVHSLFYSKRTTYLVCIDLKAYSDALIGADVSEAGARSPQMDAFVEKHIFRWIRVICAREPESEFVFVGTKADLIGNDSQLIEKISTDVMERINRKEEQVLQELARVIASLRKSIKNDLERASKDAKIRQRIRELEELRTKQARFLSKELLLASNASSSGVNSVRKELERLIIESDTSLLIPDMYQKVEEYVRAQVQASLNEKTMTAQVKSAFRNITDLRSTIEKELGFSEEEITAILHVLHDLGDILWFDELDEELADIVFMNPALVIDFIRQVINHKLAGQTEEQEVAASKSKRSRLQNLYEDVRKEGRVAHELLCELDMWYEIQDDQLTLQLKQLLFYFQLAYPAGTRGIEWNSDLIVPIYWKKRLVDDNGASVQEASYEESLTERVCWEYDFHRHLPENIFEMLGVQSYSAHYSSNRVFTRDSFETHVEGKYIARVAKKMRDDNAANAEYEDWTVLAIEVKAASREEAWQQLVWYSMNLERLLEEYPGLWVTRYTVGSEGKQYDVDQLLVEMEEHHTSPVREDVLPPSMEWYASKAWTRSETHRASSMKKDSSSLQVTDMEARFQSLLENQFKDVYARIDQSTEKMLKQLAEIGNRRDYPSLWTLEQRPQTSGLGLTTTYVLKIRSHLSGKCYHEPIVITVKSGFFGKFGVQIGYGISIFASATLGDFLSPVVEGIASEFDTAAELHSLIEGIDLSSTGAVKMESARTLSPDGTIVLLRELLTAYDSNFDPLKVSTICDLECAIIVATGEHIWAHRSEIEGRTDIIFRHDYNGGNAESASMSSADSLLAPVSRPVVAADTQPAETAQHQLEIPEPQQGSESKPIVAQSSNADLSSLQITSRDQVHQQSQLDEQKSLAKTCISLDQVSEKSASSPHSGRSSVVVGGGPTVTLRIMGVQDLMNVRLVGTQSPYCKWKLMTDKGEIIDCGRTFPHESGGTNPIWKSQTFMVDIPGGLISLDDCTLVFRVKTARGWQLSEEIAMGSFTLRDVDINDLQSGQWYEYSTTILHNKGELAGTLLFHLRVESSGVTGA